MGEGIKDTSEGYCWRMATERGQTVKLIDLDVPEKVVSVAGLVET